MERVTGIEPAWPAWKDPQGPPCSSIRVHFRRPSHSGVVHENPGLFRHLGHAKGTTAALFRGSGLVLVSVSAPEPSTLRYGFVGQAPTGADAATARRRASPAAPRGDEGRSIGAVPGLRA